MRLRRETGDFQITINSENAVNTIRKGLSAEDFVGEMVNVNGTYEVVNSASDTETGAEFKTNSFTLTYTKATGVITAQEGGSGSGSGGGGCVFDVETSDGGTVLVTPYEDIAAAIDAGKKIRFNGTVTDASVVSPGTPDQRIAVRPLSITTYGDNYRIIQTFITPAGTINNLTATIKKA